MAAASSGWSQVRRAFAILQWWFFNVLTIILNKWIFQKYNFKFPLTLSSVHFVVSSIGAVIALRVLALKPLAEVSPADRWHRLFPMSVVFCVNIVLGNVSLRWIPVSFFQTIKSFTPATTVVLQWLVWGRHFDVRIWLSLLPTVGGIVLTSVTEETFQMYGFLAAIMGCLVTSTKTILAETLLHGYKFDSLNTVYHMAPYAALLLIFPAALLEGEGIAIWLSQRSFSVCVHVLVVISLSGAIAFLLNFSIFYVIQVTTAVTFNVAGNMKVAVAILVSWLIFRNPMSFLNVLGCAITLAGCTFYGYVRQRLPHIAIIPQPPKEDTALLLPSSEKLTASRNVLVGQGDKDNPNANPSLRITIASSATTVSPTGVEACSKRL